MADRAIRLPGNNPGETYLNAERIIDAAKSADCDAIHPGYGFLSESSDFSASCRENGLKFIGPSPETLAISGNKLACKKLVESKGVPVVPYSHESVSTLEEAVRFSKEIGFPLLLKSAFGGGGRGIREARNEDELKQRFESAQREAQSSFGRFSIFIEKKLVNPRHIEVQVIASDDSHEFVHLGERDCSIQRRYQKLIEMSPSPVVDEDARKLISTLAINAAKATGYSNAGTVEFLRDSETGNFYFMEINSRLQVEHPVTELVTGVDIVATQIRIASENKLPFRQRDVKFHGCAIECRINAEDPFLDFAPTTGKIEFLSLPGGPGIRVDTALQQGIEISPYYDSLVAKLIAGGRNFEESRKRALQALEELSIVGIKTTIPFHRAVLEDARFSRGEFDTGFVESLGLSERIPTSAGHDYFIIAALLFSKNQFSTTKENSSEEQVRRPAWLTTNEKGRFIDAI